MFKKPIVIFYLKHFPKKISKRFLKIFKLRLADQTKFNLHYKKYQIFKYKILISRNQKMKIYKIPLQCQFKKSIKTKQTKYLNKTKILNILEHQFFKKNEI
jgi:hypothetical protein